MNVEFIAGIALVTPVPEKSRELYMGALGLPLDDAGGGYFHSGDIGGSKHFGVWPLPQAAIACFGTETWPEEVPVPQLSIEFEVANPEEVKAAAEELEALGFELLHGSREEPWGQTVTRLLSPENAIVGISYAPWLHD
jgi:catechol 2,3-dioxygenase-like lactoylglutathione lyase family enzyme